MAKPSKGQENADRAADAPDVPANRPADSEEIAANRVAPERTPAEDSELLAGATVEKSQAGAEPLPESRAEARSDDRRVAARAAGEVAPTHVAAQVAEAGDFHEPDPDDPRVARTRAPIVIADSAEGLPTAEVQPASEAALRGLFRLPNPAPVNEARAAGLLGQISDTAASEDRSGAAERAAGASVATATCWFCGGEKPAPERPGYELPEEYCPTCGKGDLPPVREQRRVVDSGGR